MLFYVANFCTFIANSAESNMKYRWKAPGNSRSRSELFDKVHHKNDRIFFREFNRDLVSPGAHQINTLTYANRVARKIISNETVRA